jgi:glutamyl-tRNA synthetase
MSFENIRVRFAPSPTGYLHIGGARTAIYNYLFAKASKGTFVLRVEDTDLERSRKEYEVSQVEDLKWLGLEYDEGPDKPGEFGPYRQSERLDIYLNIAHKLVEKGLAYYDFCSQEELDEMKEKATREGRPPHYTGKWRNSEFFEEAANRLASGEKAAIRFKAPEKSYVLNDLVHSRVVFPANMVGDFVIIRSSGLPVYNFCCVVDDVQMKISHVIRGEDHLNNNVRQLMIYEALEAPIPKFAHVSLLIGKDRQKLSKRHGATSVINYKEETYLPEALVNYLCLLGWSHPEEKEIFSLKELEPIFDTNRFSKSSAIYDLEKLKWVNGMHIRNLDVGELQKQITVSLDPEHPFFNQTQTWQKKAVELFQNQIEFYKDFGPLLNKFIFRSEVADDKKTKEFISLETTQVIKSFVKEQISKSKSDFIASDDLKNWMEILKTQHGIKGKNLFMGVRVLLTGISEGPELAELVSLIPLGLIQKRLS